MNPTEGSVAHKILLVDDDDGVRTMMTLTLEHKGFDVVAAASVPGELIRQCVQPFFPLRFVTWYPPLFFLSQC